MLENRYYPKMKVFEDNVNPRGRTHRIVPRLSYFYRTHPQPGNVAQDDFPLNINCYNNAAPNGQMYGRPFSLCAKVIDQKHSPNMQKKTYLILVPILINKMTKLVINTENGARNQCKVGWITVNVPNK
jgi:hypothetical protein